MNWQPDRIFLLDGIGALLSALLLSLVLVPFERVFGMPPRVLYPLAAIAFIFFTYSITCYWRVRQNWRPYLKAIAIANVSYCLLTGVFVFLYYQRLTALGLTYFLAEMLVVLILVRIELRAVSRS